MYLEACVILIHHTKVFKIHNGIIFFILLEVGGGGTANISYLGMTFSSLKKLMEPAERNSTSKVLSL